MRRCCVIIAILACTLAAAVALAAPTLVGKWQAKTMEMKGESKPVPEGMKVVIEFGKGGKFTATMEAKDREGKLQKKVEKGTWKVEGDTLTTTGKKKTETMTFKVEGKSLTLIKAERGEKMILSRVK